MSTALNPIALHLLSCHVPFTGGCFAVGLLLIGLRREDRSLLWAADLAVLCVGLASAVAWATGPAALNALGSWVDPAAESFAERHATLGELATIVWALASVTGLWGLFLRANDKPSPRWRRAALLGLTLLGIGLSAWAGHEGGRIRHDELRDGAALTTSTLIEP